jgi:hypothetical protein
MNGHLMTAVPENAEWILRAILRDEHEPGIEVETPAVVAKPAGIKRIAKSTLRFLYRFVRPIVQPFGRRLREFLNAPVMTELALVKSQWAASEQELAELKKILQDMTIEIEEQTVTLRWEIKEALGSARKQS